jgi:tetratricopeptide (TPR) repeat protein
MESDDDASSFKSFSDTEHSAERVPVAVPDVPTDALSTASLGNSHASSAVGGEAASGGALDDGERGFEYDESLPDGSSFRRRRRSVMEADELPAEKKDLEAALAFKSEGNRHFGLSDHDTAAACYTEALRHLPLDATSDSHRAICYANRGACHFACGRLHEAVYDCDRALEFNGAYAKALARRAAVLEKLGKLEEASKGAARP